MSPAGGPPEVRNPAEELRARRSFVAYEALGEAMAAVKRAMDATPDEQVAKEGKRIRERLRRIRELQARWIMPDPAQGELL